MVCCGGSSKVHVERVVTVLVVGAANSGKSLLLKMLRRRFDASTARPPKKKPVIASSQDEGVPTTRPTIGVEVENVSLPSARVLLQEVGGSMTLMWPRYYEPCECVVYVVDAADLSSLAAAWIELLTLLNDEKCAAKPVTVVLNKTDLPDASVPDVQSLMALDKLQGRIKVIEGSLTDGSALVDEVRAGILATVDAAAAADGVR